MRILWQWKPRSNLLKFVMHECCYFSISPEILVNRQFVFVNLLIVLEVNKCYWYLCYCSGSTNAVGHILLFWGPKHKDELLHYSLVNLFDKKKSQWYTPLATLIYRVGVITTWSRQCRHNENAKYGENKFMTWFT